MAQAPPEELTEFDSTGVPAWILADIVEEVEEIGYRGEGHRVHLIQVEIDRHRRETSGGKLSKGQRARRNAQKRKNSILQAAAGLSAVPVLPVPPAPRHPAPAPAASADERWRRLVEFAITFFEFGHR